MKYAIEIYTKSNQDEEIKELVVTAFQSKFDKLVNLDKGQLLHLLNNFWAIPQNSDDEKQIVVKDGNSVCATMLIKKKSPKKKQLDLDFFSLFRQYGFKNVIKLIVGLIALEHSVKNREYYIDHIAVAKAYRGKGIGKALITWAQDYIEKEKELTLFVSAHNSNAIQLYKKAGFVIKHKKRSFWRGILFLEPRWYFMEWRKR